MKPDFHPRTIATCLAYSALIGMGFFGLAIGTARSVIWGAVWGIVFVVLFVSNLYFLHLIQSLHKERLRQKRKYVKPHSTG